MSRLEELRARIDAREARIGVIGLGYVGLPLAVEFAKAGYAIVGFDVDEKKVEALRAGRSYVEDVPAEEVERARQAGCSKVALVYGGACALSLAVACSLSLARARLSCARLPQPKLTIPSLEHGSSAVPLRSPTHA